MRVWAVVLALVTVVGVSVLAQDQGAGRQVRRGGAFQELRTVQQSIQTEEVKAKQKELASFAVKPIPSAV